MAPSPEGISLMHTILRMRSRRSTLVLVAISALLGPAAAAAPASAAPAPGKLTVALTAPTTATAGSPFDYVVKVTNPGTSPARTTTLTDQLPADTTLVGFNHGPGISCSSAGTPTTVTCSLGDLAPAASASVTIAVTPTKAETLTDTASATDAAGDTGSASATTTVSAAPAAGTAPVATTVGNRSVTTNSATLLGAISPGNQSTAYFFEVGTTGSYGTVTPIGRTGTSQMTVKAAVRGLKRGTVYHYRLIAINDSGTSYGVDRTFRTLGSNYLGALVLRATRLYVRRGVVSAPFWCNSSKACGFRWTIVIHTRSAKTHRITTVVFTKTSEPEVRIPAHRTITESVGVQPGALSLLERARHRTLLGRLTTRPRSNQRGIIQTVVLQG
jgi:uncharacterized repeat protein (TIGR01451 family)